MAGLCTPLPTLRPRPCGRRRTAQGRCGSLLLHRKGLAPSTPCRSPGASQFRSVVAPLFGGTTEAVGSLSRGYSSLKRMPAMRATSQVDPDLPQAPSKRKPRGERGEVHVELSQPGTRNSAGQAIASPAPAFEKIWCDADHTAGAGMSVRKPP